MKHLAFILERVLNQLRSFTYKNGDNNSALWLLERLIKIQNKTKQATKNSSSQLLKQASKQTKTTTKKDQLLKASMHRTWKMESGRLGVQGQSGLNDNPSQTKETQKTAVINKIQTPRGCFSGGRLVKTQIKHIIDRNRIELLSGSWGIEGTSSILGTLSPSLRMPPPTHRRWGRTPEETDRSGSSEM